jgi:hypothetical protein
VATGILFGLIPAVDATHLDLNSSLKEGGRGSSGGRGGERLRRVLVVTQVGVAVVLLVGAGILIRSFSELTKVRLGFDPAHVITAQLSAAGTRYDSSAAVNQFYDGVLDAVAKSPGVVAVGASMGLPLIGVASSSIAIAGEPFNATNPPGVLFGVVRGDYFKAMGIPFKSGRLFDATDLPDGPQTAIISEAAA